MLYYIFKKASKGIDSKERIKLINWRLRPLVIVSIAFNLFFILYLEANFIQSTNDNSQFGAKNISCNSPIWMSTNIFEFMTVIIFMLFVAKLD